MKSFFTSDLHLGHEAIALRSGRPFSTVDEHDSCILDEINRMVTKHDRLFILGDFCWHSPQEYLKRITCKNRHLIVGNHDRQQSFKCFATHQDTRIVKLGGEHKTFLSHYPHAYWPASHYGSLHLYGHMHGQRESTLDNLFPMRRAMDCGVDVAFKLTGSYRPFLEMEILALLLPKSGHDPVTFYRDQRDYGNRPNV